MPWHVAKSDACPADSPWAVVQDSNDEVVGCHKSKEKAMNQMAALYANEDDGSRIQNTIEAAHALDRGIRRYVPFEVVSVRQSGSPDKKHIYYVQGKAAVFNRWSLDLGGFRERILTGAFDTVLRDDPHVLHVIDHDTSTVLSSTLNNTLKLTADEEALHYDSTIDDRRSYAADLKLNLEMGLIDQSSFAFTVPDDGSGEEWRIADDGVVERHVIQVDGLYDVTTCAMGAYPMTSAALALRSAAIGRRSGGAEPLVALGGKPNDVAPNGVGERQTENKTVADSAEIARLKRDSDRAAQVARERFHRLKERS
jgi:uncharacterized protein